MQPTTAVQPRRPKVAATTMIAAAAGVIVFAVLVAALAWALRSQTFVSRVEVVNDTPDSINVELVGDRGRVVLGTAPAGSRLELQDVLDQGGDHWTFEFSYAGVDAGQLTVERSAFDAGGGTIEVPASVRAELEGQGFAPSA